MKNLVRVLFALLFMVTINACSDSFAEVQQDMVEERTDGADSNGSDPGPQ